jgi:hypothetical protein
VCRKTLLAGTGPQRIEVIRLSRGLGLSANPAVVGRHRGKVARTTRESAVSTVNPARAAARRSSGCGCQPELTGDRPQRRNDVASSRLNLHADMVGARIEVRPNCGSQDRRIAMGD